MRRLFSCFLTWLLLVRRPGRPGRSPGPIRRRRFRPTDPAASALPVCQTIRTSFWNVVSIRSGRGTGQRPSRPITRPSSAGRAGPISAAGFGCARSISSCTAAIPTPASATSCCDLPHDQAVDLYDEVLDRIQTNYVDPVPLEPLVRHGLDNLEVALRDPVFRQDQRAGGHPRARRPGCATRSGDIGPSWRFRTGRRRSGWPSRAASWPERRSAWRRRPSCWNSPAARATPSTTSRAT